MLISVVIPVFNTKVSFLRQCIDSVLQHDNIEVLIINDGSTDVETTAACQEFATNCEQVRIFEITNSGPSVSRNVGIVHSSGEYIIFLDSDDWWSGNFLEQSAQLIGQATVKPDIIIAGAQKVECGTGFTKYIGIKNEAVTQWETGADALKTLLKQDVHYEWYAWKYLIRRTFLLQNNLHFQEGVYYEDVEFTPRMLYAAAQVISLPDVFVNYRFHNPTSILNTPNVKKSNDKILVVQLLRKYAEKHFDAELSQLFYKNISQLYLSAYGDYINGNGVNVSQLKDGFPILKWNVSRFGKAVYWCVKALGFELGTKVIKIILQRNS